MRLTCNAPVMLTLTTLSVFIYLLDTYIIPGFVASYCSSPHSLTDPNAFLRLFSYPFGHRSWVQLVTNYALLLLIGQILEKRYNALQLLSVIIVSVVLTGLINTFIQANPLVGSDGISVCMVLFISLSYVRKGELPLSLVVIVILFFIAEFDTLFNSDNLSRLSILTGAVLAVLYGLTLKPRYR